MARFRGERVIEIRAKVSKAPPFIGSPNTPIRSQLKLDMSHRCQSRGGASRFTPLAPTSDMCVPHGPADWASQTPSWGLSHTCTCACTCEDLSKLLRGFSGTLPSRARSSGSPFSRARVRNGIPRYLMKPYCRLGPYLLRGSQPHCSSTAVHAIQRSKFLPVFIPQCQYAAVRPELIQTRIWGTIRFSQSPRACSTSFTVRPCTRR